MIITKMLGITFNEYGNTKDDLPSDWVKVEFNIKKRNHRDARDSPNTRVIIRMEGWKFTGGRNKPILVYYTNTPEMVKRVIEYGDIQNAEKFILNCGG